MQHQSLGVKGLGRQWALVAQVQLGVYIVFDQRELVASDQRDQRFFLRFGHQAAQRVLKGGHQPTGLGAVAHDGGLQCGQVNALPRVGGHLDGVQTHALQRLQGGVERGRLDQHRIARPGDGGQTQVQRFERAVGNDDVVCRHRHARRQVAQRDLAAQARMAGRKVVHRAPRVERPGAGGQRLA